MSLMKGWQYTTATGGLEKNLCFKNDLPKPSIESLSPDQLLIETLYVSLNPADYKAAEFGLYAKILIRPPATPGYDFCGRVHAVHPSNQLLRPNDLVFGSLGHPQKYGTLCQYFVADQLYCSRVPVGVSLEDAAAIPSAAMAAYKSITPFIKSRQNVFINGGSGGVGAFAIQIAKILGADVTVSYSSRNAEFCQELGAQVIDYTKGDLISLLQEHGQIFDYVVDNIGTTPELYSLTHTFTNPGAQIVQVVLSEVLPMYVVGLPNKEDITLLGSWVAEGKIRINIDAKFSFEDTIKAFEKLKSGRTRGKIIVEVAAP